MNPSQDLQSGNQNPAELSQGPGRRLRELRESRGIEIERVIAQLHLQRGVVEALEQDRYENLPPPVFIAGYLKNYARLLGADPDPIVAAYRASLPDYAQHTSPAIVSHKPRRSGGPWAWIVILALIGGGAAGAAFWWQGQQKTAVESTADGLADTENTDATPTSGNVETAEQPEEEAPQDSDTQVPPDTIPLRTLEPTPASTAAAEEPPTAAQSTTQAEADTEAPAPATQAEEAPPEKTGPPEVVLEFTGTTWIDVRDAKGKVVLNGEMGEGERRVLTGEPPYKLVIGNAAATRMTIGDKPFDIESRARGNVARFSLDPTTP
ncbi:helix-turn-helix domain-containing protein [Thiorhodococcus fuscus]|uniref:Helix-turn-helix domain-containing protein n=1 Tax=Thiorhodococcus fuscus TaxID=527200 RepID=A0ABW4YCK0_9GAMM